MSKKKALITGVTGQDGYYLVNLLNELGYEIYGLIRRNSRRSMGTMDFLPKEILDSMKFVYGDVTDPSSIQTAMRLIMPDEVYHLAAVSFTGVSWDLAHEVINTNVIGTLNLLNSVLSNCRNARVFVAGSSSVFGNNALRLQNEMTPFNPCSPYGTSKAAAFNLAKNFRDAYSMFVANGILFNHESPVRGIEFVSKKVCRAVALIANGITDKLQLGNISVARDWGYAADHVRAMNLILQQDKPDDYVIATGVSHTVEDFVREAFSCAGLNYRDHVEHSDRFVRPSDISYMCGDSTKLKNATGWNSKVDFNTLVKFMVEQEMESVRDEIGPVSKKEDTNEQMLIVETAKPDDKCADEGGETE